MTNEEGAIEKKLWALSNGELKFLADYRADCFVMSYDPEQVPEHMRDDWRKARVAVRSILKKIEDLPDEGEKD